MVRIPDQYHLPPLVPGIPGNGLDAPNVGAGPIDHPAAPILQNLVSPLRLPMGTDNDGFTRLRLLRPLNQTGTAIAQILYHLAIVNHRSQHSWLLAVCNHFFCQLHRPADTITEACRFCKQHLHLIQSP